MNSTDDQHPCPHAEMSFGLDLQEIGEEDNSFLRREARLHDYKTSEDLELEKAASHRKRWKKQMEKYEKFYEQEVKKGGNRPSLGEASRAESKRSGLIKAMLAKSGPGTPKVSVK